MVFARAADALLDKLGKPSTLRGVSCGNANVQYDLTLDPAVSAYSEDNPVVRFTVASIRSTYTPRPGDTLVHPDGSFKLDRRIRDNGRIARFIAIKLP
jgi:hypothetical protein